MQILKKELECSDFVARMFTAVIKKKKKTPPKQNKQNG